MPPVSRLTHRLDRLVRTDPELGQRELIPTAASSFEPPAMGEYWDPHVPRWIRTGTACRLLDSDDRSVSKLSAPIF
jgi:hypothetical protein